MDINIEPPKITIIVPLYNKVDEIERALHSIFNQTVSGVEVLVIDGGSTDGSLDIVKKYQEDNSIKLIHQKSNGLPAARNEAILQAEGDLIAFLDADDEWHPDYLETIIRLYYKYPDAGLYGTRTELFLKSGVKTRIFKGIPTNWDGYLDSWFTIYALNKGSPFCPSSAVIPKNTYLKVGYYNESARISEDIDMWVRIAYSLPIVLTTEVHVRYYRFAENKMSIDFRPVKELPPITYLESIPKKDLAQRVDYKDIINTIDYQKIVTAYYNLGAGEKIWAKEALDAVTSNTYKQMYCLLKVLTCLPACIGKNVIKFIAYMRVTHLL